MDTGRASTEDYGHRRCAVHCNATLSESRLHGLRGGESGYERIGPLPIAQRDGGANMGDFFQNGVITTLHDLGTRRHEELEAELRSWAAQHPMTLIIPALASEIDGPALPAIIETLASVDFLDEIVVGLDLAERSDVERAQSLLSAVQTPYRIIWHDGPRMQAIHQQLLAHGLAPSERGKGYNVWYCMGYLLASGRSDVVAIHDADIVTYSRSMLVRLLYPVANPTFDYAFCKGFYYRADQDRFNGRVTRLLVTPLVRALRDVLGLHPYLEFLDSFRYPLAGDVAMKVETVRSLTMPADWGLEVGMLSDVFATQPARRICQVDIAGAYDHKHQELAVDDPNRGIHRMAIDITTSIVHALDANGSGLTEANVRQLNDTYRNIARDMIDRYLHDAEMNGFVTDRRSEEQLVDLFAQAVKTATTSSSNPPTVPPWAVVQEQLPDTLDALASAIHADNA